MKQRRNHIYSSCIGAVITGLIDERRNSGFMYNSAANVLKQLDDFCIERGFSCSTVTRELSEEWCMQRDTEGLNARNIRVSVLRQLSKYILSLGEEAYMPPKAQSEVVRIPHIFSNQERNEFFMALDSIPPTRVKHGDILLMECKVIFRLYYCCGFRTSEPLELKWENTNLDRGWIKIIQSKGYKDRILWLPDDILEMMKNYKRYISKIAPYSIYVFPGIKEGGHISEGTIRLYFLKVLKKTSCAGLSNPPTIKSFRHTFVVDRLNTWMETGEDIWKKLPFLCKFLGHSSINESLYYYHQVEDGLKIIRTKDKTSNKVIPEVIPYEE